MKSKINKVNFRLHFNLRIAKLFLNFMKSAYGEVYENKSWIKKKIDEILDTLIDAKIEDRRNFK